jgi:O-antigen/teichoic acid export membrane protein
LVIFFISPSVVTFFTCQVAVNAGMLIPCAMALWKNLPKSSLPPRFSRSILLESRGFVGYMGAISATSIVFSQLDRIVLSRFVTLEQLGFYTIAWTLAGSIYMLQSPVYASMFPKLTRLMTVGDMHNLARLYHTGCQLISVLTIPLAMLAVFFPLSILTIWTKNSQIAANAGRVLVLLSLSAILSSAAQLPFALQQARGWVKATLLTNLIGLLITIPIASFAVVQYGMLGGASVFLIIKGLCSIVQCEITHARVLHRVRRAWYLRDVGLPLMVSVTVVGASGLLWSDRNVSATLTPVRMLAIYATTTAAVTLSTPRIRKYVIKRMTPGPLSCASWKLSLCNISRRGKWRQV